MQGSPSAGQAFGQGVEDHCLPMLCNFVFILPLALTLYLLFSRVVLARVCGPAALTATAWGRCT